MMPLDRQHVGGALLAGSIAYVFTHLSVSAYAEWKQYGGHGWLTLCGVDAVFAAVFWIVLLGGLLVFK